MAEFRFFHLNAKGNLVAVETLEKTIELRKMGGGFVWIDLYEPCAASLGTLAEPFNLHPLSVEDCLDQDQIPKIEAYPDNTFILCNAFSYLKQELVIDEIDFILGKDYLISVHGLNAEGRRHFGKIEEKISRNMTLIRRGPDFLMHVLFDNIVDQKFGVFEVIQDELDVAEEAVLKDTRKFKPELVLRLRRCLMMLRKSLFHEREILTKICRKDSVFICEKAMFHFRDIFDHLSRFFEMTEIYREMVTSLMELYVSLMNNRMTQVSNQTNMVMKRLTLITTIFMPLTLLSGIGGMSEWSMITGPENWMTAYPVFFLIMGLMGVANYFVLKALKWID